MRVAAIAGVMAAASTTHAQSVPVLVTSIATAPGAQATRDTASLASALENRVLIGPALSSAIEERYGSRDRWTDTMQPVRTRITRSRRAYGDAIANGQAAVAEALLRSLEEDAQTLLSQPEGLDRMRENREALMSALLFVAESSHADRPARASEAARRLAEAIPELTLGPRAASAAVRQLYREQVTQLANASLVVQSVPDACVVRRNGQTVGNAPAQLQGLVAGSHRVSIQCGGRSSLVHRVNVGAGATSTVQIDIGIDRALEFGDMPTLRYDNAQAESERFVNDSAVIANALGSDRVIVLHAQSRRAALIDVLSKRVLFESEPGQFTELARVIRGAPATNTTSNTASDHSTDRSTPRVAVDARPRRRRVRSTPPVDTSAAAPSGGLMLFGLVFAGTGVLFAGGGTAAWLGANYVAGRSRSLGDDGLVLGGVATSVGSGEAALRPVAVGGWIAGGLLLGTGITMVSLALTRREPTVTPTVRAMFSGNGLMVGGTF